VYLEFYGLTLPPFDITPASPPPPEPKSQGIFFAPVRPGAIVNSKTVSVGDHLGNFQVKEISKNSVTLEKADQPWKILELGR
jgi:hypothetical protein